MSNRPNVGVFENEQEAQEALEWLNAHPLTPREMFLEHVELWPWEASVEGHPPLALLAGEIEGYAVPLGAIVERIADNQIILPEWACDCLGMPQGSTYAEAAQMIFEHYGIRDA